jgi:hypothetical protein
MTRAGGRHARVTRSRNAMTSSSCRAQVTPYYGFFFFHGSPEGETLRERLGLHMRAPNNGSRALLCFSSAGFMRPIPWPECRQICWVLGLPDGTFLDRKSQFG